VSTLAQFLRRRALALVAVLAALGIVVGGAVALEPAPQPRPDATCGYVYHITIIGVIPVWTCWGAGGGGGGSW
jgi:hypothetical protein